MLTRELAGRMSEAMDGQPVDLIFLLLALEGAGVDHLKALPPASAA